MRVPVAPPSGGAKSWGASKKKQEEATSNVPAWKQKLKAKAEEKPATPAVPAWKQKLKAAPATAAASSLEPAWKQKLKSSKAPSAAAASSSEPAWKQKLKSNKPATTGPSPPDVPAWKAKLKSARTPAAPSSSVPAWQANLKSPHSPNKPSTAAETENEPVVANEPTSPDPTTEATATETATGESETPPTAEENATPLKAVEASDSDSGGDLSDDSGDSDTDSGGGFNFDADSSSSDDDDDSDGLFDDDKPAPLIPKHELDYDKRMSVFFEVSEQLKEGNDDNGIDGEETAVETPATAVTDVDKDMAAFAIGGDSNTDETIRWADPADSELIALTTTQEEEEDDDDYEVDTGVEMVAMEVQKLKMQQALLAMEDDLDSAADSLEDEEANWMAPAKPSLDVAPEIDYQAILEKTKEAQRRNGTPMNSSTASLGTNASGIDHSGNDGGGSEDGGVFYAKLDDMNMSNSSVPVSLGQFEIDMVENEEKDELPVESWMMEVDEGDSPDVDYAMLLNKIGEADDDDEYSMDEVDVAVPQFEFDAEHLTAEAAQMDKLAEGFDKTIDATQGDLEATTREFVLEANKTAEEGSKHKRRLTEKITTMLEYDAENDPNLEGKHRNLMVFMHGAKCEVSAGVAKCDFQFCKASKAMMQHVTVCKDRHCKMGYCPGSKYVLRHAKQINMAMLKKTQAVAARQQAVEQAQKQQQKARCRGGSSMSEEEADNAEQSRPPIPHPILKRNRSAGSGGSIGSLASTGEDSDEDDTSSEEDNPMVSAVPPFAFKEKIINKNVSEEAQSKDDQEVSNGSSLAIARASPKLKRAGSPVYANNEEDRDESDSSEETGDKQGSAKAKPRMKIKRASSPIYANDDSDLDSDSDSGENRAHASKTTTRTKNTKESEDDIEDSDAVDDEQDSGAQAGSLIKSTEAACDAAKWVVEYSDDEETSHDEESEIQRTPEFPSVVPESQAPSDDPSAMVDLLEEQEDKTRTGGELESSEKLDVKRVDHEDSQTTLEKDDASINKEVTQSKPGEASEGGVNDTSDASTSEANAATGSVTPDSESDESKPIEEEIKHPNGESSGDDEEQVELSIAFNEREVVTEASLMQGPEVVADEDEVSKNEGSTNLESVTPDGAAGSCLKHIAPLKRHGAEETTEGEESTADEFQDEGSCEALADDCKNKLQASEPAGRGDMHRDVRFKTSTGRVALTSSELRYQANNAPEAEPYCISWGVIVKQQASPPSHIKHLLKLVLSADKPATFQLDSREALEILRDNIATKLKDFEASKGQTSEVPMLECNISALGSHCSEPGAENNEILKLTAAYAMHVKDADAQPMEETHTNFVASEGTNEGRQQGVHRRIRFQKAVGCVVLTASDLCFQAAGCSEPYCVSWILVTKQQVGPISHTKHLLKINLSNGNRPLTFQCENRAALERLRLDIAAKLNDCIDVETKQPVIFASSTPPTIPPQSESSLSAVSPEYSTGATGALVYQPVEFKSLTGSLTFKTEELVFIPADMDPNQSQSISIPWGHVLKHQASPEKSGKHMLKLALTSGKSATFKLQDRQTLEELQKNIAERLRARDGVSDRVRSSEDGHISTIYNSIQFKTATGALSLDGNQLLFRPTGICDEKDEQPQVTISWAEVEKHQASPSSSKKHMLKIALLSGGAVTFKLQDRQTLEDLQKDISSRLKSSPDQNSTSSQECTNSVAKHHVAKTAEPVDQQENTMSVDLEHLSINADKKLEDNAHKQPEGATLVREGVKRVEEERLAVDAAKTSEGESHAANKAVEERLAVAAKKAEDEMLAAEAVKKEEEEEGLAIEAANKAVEERFAIAAMKKAEAEKIDMQAAKKAEEERLAVEAAKKAEEETLAVEAAKKAENEMLAAEVAMKAEEERLTVEASNKAVEEKFAIAATKKAEAEKIDMQAAKKAEEERLAVEAAKKAEEERLAVEAAKKAEKEKLAAEVVKKAEEERITVEASKTTEKKAAKQKEEERLGALQKADEAAAKQRDDERLAALRKAKAERLASEAALEEAKHKRCALEVTARIAEEERLAREASAKIAKEEILLAKAAKEERNTKATQDKSAKAEAAKAKKKKLAQEKVQKAKQKKAAKVNAAEESNDEAAGCATESHSTARERGKGVSPKKETDGTVKAPSVYEPIQLNNLTGSLLLDKDHLRFMPSNGKQGGRADIPWVYIVKQEASSLMSAKASLKIYLSGEKMVTLHLKNRSVLGKLKKDITNRVSARDSSKAREDPESELDEKLSSIANAEEAEKDEKAERLTTVGPKASTEDKDLTNPPKKTGGLTTIVSNKDVKEPPRKTLEDRTLTPRLYKPVKFKSQPGSLSLDETTFTFKPNKSANDGEAVSVGWGSIAKCQENPPKNAKALFKIVLKDGKQYTFQMKERSTMAELENDVNMHVQKNQTKPTTTKPGGEVVIKDMTVDPTSDTAAGQGEERTSKPSTDGATRYYPVTVGNRKGTLLLDGEQMKFSTSKGDGNGDRSFLWTRVVNSQENPPKNAKALLRMKMTNGNSTTFQLKNRAQLSELQNDITKRLSIVVVSSSETAPNSNAGVAKEIDPSGKHTTVVGSENLEDNSSEQNGGAEDVTDDKTKDVYKTDTMPEQDDNTEEEIRLDSDAEAVYVMDVSTKQATVATIETLEERTVEQNRNVEDLTVGTTKEEGNVSEHNIVMESGPDDGEASSTIKSEEEAKELPIVASSAADKGKDKSPLREGAEQEQDSTRLSSEAEVVAVDEHATETSDEVPTEQSIRDCDSSVEPEESTGETCYEDAVLSEDAEEKEEATPRADNESNLAVAVALGVPPEDYKPLEAEVNKESRDTVEGVENTERVARTYATLRTDGTVVESNGSTDNDDGEAMGQNSVHTKDTNGEATFCSDTNSVAAATTKDEGSEHTSGDPVVTEDAAPGSANDAQSHLLRASEENANPEMGAADEPATTSCDVPQMEFATEGGIENDENLNTGDTTERIDLRSSTVPAEDEGVSTMNGVHAEEEVHLENDDALAEEPTKQQDEGEIIAQAEIINLEHLESEEDSASSGASSSSRSSSSSSSSSRSASSSRSSSSLGSTGDASPLPPPLPNDVVESHTELQSDLPGDNQNLSPKRASLLCFDTEADYRSEEEEDFDFFPDEREMTSSTRETSIQPTDITDNETSATGYGKSRSQHIAAEDCETAPTVTIVAGEREPGAEPDSIAGVAPVAVKGGPDSDTSLNDVEPTAESQSVIVAEKEVTLDLDTVNQDTEGYAPEATSVEPGSSLELHSSEKTPGALSRAESVGDQPSMPNSQEAPISTETTAGCAETEKPGMETETSAEVNVPLTEPTHDPKLAEESADSSSSLDQAVQEGKDLDTTKSLQSSSDAAEQNKENGTTHIDSDKDQQSEDQNNSPTASGEEELLNPSPETETEAISDVEDHAANTAEIEDALAEPGQSDHEQFKELKREITAAGIPFDWRQWRKGRGKREGESVGFRWDAPAEDWDTDLEKSHSKRKSKRISELPISKDGQKRGSTFDCTEEVPFDWVDSTEQVPFNWKKWQEDREKLRPNEQGQDTTMMN